jgi:uncharacterized protein
MNTPLAKSQSAFGVRQILGRYPLTTFFLLTYALSWWSIPFGGQLPHGPALAAILVLAVTEGRHGLAGLWRQFTRWRVAWYWYCVAPGIVVGYHLVALGLNLLRGATLAETASLDGWRVLLLVLPLLALGGQWEELGWCGYALPRLQQRFAHLAYGPLIASLILGVLRGVWHLPLFAYGFIPWYDVVFLSLAMQFTLSWLYNRTGGSLPVVMLLHLTSNVAGVIMPLLFTGVDFAGYSRLFVILACLCALIIVGVAGPALGATPQKVKKNVVTPDQIMV